MPPKDASKSNEQDKKNKGKNQGKKSNKNKSKRRVNIPYARGFRLRTRDYKKIPVNKNKIVIEGEDLIIPTPDTFPNLEVKNSVFLCFPANPTYWKGTRIAGLSTQYQQYRPLLLKVRYIPQVPVTTPGQVIFGTLFNEAVPSGSLQQTLMTSPGGGMVQCYLEGYSNVPCNNDTLPMKLYNLHDGVTEIACNPFFWVAHYSGAWQNASTPTTSQPGWIFVKWKYEFTVGKGNSGDESITMNQTDQPTASATNSFAGWGVALSTLKSIGQRLLSHIGIFLLNETVAQATRASGKLTTKLGVGTTLAVEPNSIVSSRNETTTLCRDSDGNELTLTDDTRVCVYMSGQDWKESSNEPLRDIVGIAFYTSSDGENFVKASQYYEEYKAISWYRIGFSPSEYFEISLSDYESGHFIATDFNYFGPSASQTAYILQVRTNYFAFNLLSKTNTAQAIHLGNSSLWFMPTNIEAGYTFPTDISYANKILPSIHKNLFNQRIPASDPYC